MFEPAGCPQAASRPPQPSTIPIRCRKGAEYIPGPARLGPIRTFRRIFLVPRATAATTHCRWTSFTAEQRPANPGKLYVVKKSGHQFGADHRAGQQSTANGPGSKRPAPGLGTFRAKCHQPIQHFRHVRTSVRPRQALAQWQQAGLKAKIGMRLAGQRNWDVLDRLPVYTADRLEPLR